MSSIVSKLTCACAIVLLAGCSTLTSLNPFASKPGPRNPPAALVDFQSTLSIRTVWSTSIGDAGANVFSPAVSGSKIFVAAADGTIARLDASNGRADWRISAGVPLTAGVGTDGNTIAVAGEKGSVLVFDANGQQRWKAQTSSEVLSSPAVGMGLVVVRSLDNRIVAFDAESGVRRWSLQRSVPSLTLRSAPGIVISGTSVYVALPGGKLLALAVNNGGARWEATVGDPRGATELERIADISGAPVVLGRAVCAVAYQGRVGCFDAVTGAAIWAKELSSDTGLGADERFIFAADEHGALHAFSRESGTSVWRNNKMAYRHLATPISFGRAVAAGDNQGFVHFLSREDGALLARIATDGSSIIAAPQLVDSKIIFQTKAGSIIALGMN